MGKAPKKLPAETQTILDYMVKQNRPYSVTDVFNNLKGEIGKTAVQKALTQLSDDGYLTAKPYGKQVVYFNKQENLPTLSAEEIGQYDNKIERTTERIAELKSELKVLQSTMASLSNSLSDQELKIRHKELKRETDQLQERLHQLRDGGKQLTAEEKEAIEKKLLEGRKMWAQRKKLFKEIWGAFTENLPKKPKEYLEELGIETDEMVGADFNADITV